MKPFVSLGEIFIKYELETNPVTKSVYRDILRKRLDKLERDNDK